MDFAPYQDVSPETHRALSPPPRPSLDAPGRRSFSPGFRRPSPIPSPSPPIQNNSYIPNIAANLESGFGGGGSGRAGRLNEFETSLPIRLDYEACMAYLVLPPLGGVLLLVLERKSDYVR